MNRMDDGGRLSWLIVVLLLFAAAFFSMAETAFASVSRIRLKTDLEKGDPRAKKALFVTDNFERAITTILICTNILHLAVASIVTVAVTNIWGLTATTISTVITAIAVFFAAEMLPKSIARKYSERLSLALAGSLSFFMAVFKPLASLLAGIGSRVASHTKGDSEATVTEDELHDIIDDMTEEGTLEDSQGDLISSALQFGDITVESVLTSRVDVAAIDVSMSNSDILSFIREQTHSRLPVYEDSIDNVIGTLQIRKYLKEYIKKGEALDIRPLLDEPYFIHMSAKIDDVLPVLSKKKLNMAIVTDNYGGTLGIVTVEDILEELVGDIWDEDDTVVESMLPLSDGSYSVDAAERVGDVFDELEIDYDEDEDSDLVNKLMGELAYENFPSIPKEGDSFTYRGLKIAVMSMDHNRILRLKVTVLPREELKEAGGDQE